MKLLISESPLQVLPSLAVKIGLNQALVLQQMHYWLRISKNVHDNFTWVYKTMDEWHVEFPFWSKSTLERIVKKLEDDELIVVGNFNRMKMDRTKWYRLNYEEINKLCDAYSSQINDMQPGELTESNLETCESPSHQNDGYNASNLTVPITIDYTENTTENTTETSSSSSSDFENENEDEDEEFAYTAKAESKNLNNNAWQFYEQNGFGKLNPYVAEKIATWMNEFTEEMILYAMKIAIENNVQKWTYVEAVLKDWRLKKLNSIAAVEAHKRGFAANKMPLSRNQQSREHVPDWFHNRHNKSAAEEDHDDIDFEAERKKLLEKLGKA